jgi:hypothetical protein
MDSVRKLNQAINKTIHKSGLDRRVLQNKYVLYTTVVICVLNVFGMIMSGDLTTPLLFVLVGLLTSFFCKNMLVILGLGLVVANIAKYGLGVGGLGSDAGPEGFETGADEGAGASEPHEIVDTEQYLEKDADKDKGKDNDKDKNKGAKEAQKKMQATNQKMEAMQNQYKKLEGLQNQILDGMKQVTDGLDQADKVLENLKKNANGVANAPP